MTTIFGIKGFSLDEYAISANAILGIRDSGKTYTATKAAEELFDAGIPFVALDPIGVWQNLRIPGAGRGYPVVVAGGRRGDLPLTVGNAAKIVRAAMEANVSLVIDLFSIELSKSDWRRIVMDCVKLLLHENADYGLRHIFIEEAAEFVPQKPQDGQVFAAVEKLVRMGGNAKLGCTLINQRSADLNKSVLELCANVFVHRQKGKNTLLDLKKWFTLLDLSDEQEKNIAVSLPNLTSGECWALINDLRKPVFLKIPRKNSLHPDRRAAQATPAEFAKRKPVAADEFVGLMKAKLAEKKPDAPKLTTTHVGIFALPKGATKPNAFTLMESERQRAAETRMAEARGFEAGKTAAIAALAELGPLVKAAIEQELTAKAIGDIILPRVLLHVREASGKIKAAKQACTPQPSAAKPAAPLARPSGAGNGYGAVRPSEAVLYGVNRGEGRILTAIAQSRGGCSRAQLTVLTGYKKSSRDTYLQRLAHAGLIEASGTRLVATQSGLFKLGPEFAPLPIGLALREHVLANLPQGERRILECVIESYPAPAPRDAISEHSGYLKSSRDTYLQRLTARELVITTKDGVRASSTLFDEQEDG